MYYALYIRRTDDTDTNAIYTRAFFDSMNPPVHYMEASAVSGNNAKLFLNRV